MAAWALSRVAKVETVVSVLSAAKVRKDVEPDGISIMLKHWLELNTWRCIKWWCLKKKPSSVSVCQSALTKAIESAVKSRWAEACGRVATEKRANSTVYAHRRRVFVADMWREGV